MFVHTVESHELKEGVAKEDSKQKMVEPPFAKFVKTFSNKFASYLTLRLILTLSIQLAMSSHE